MFALMFPGQGSQSLGMLQDWAQQSSIVTETFSQASSQLNYDLWALVQTGPDEKLNQTQYTQAAILTASIALYRIFTQGFSAKPSYLVGHSLGEYTALVCAGVLEFETAVKLVELRGRLMQEAVPLGVGAMAAIVGLKAEEVEALCKTVSTLTEYVTPANYNADTQVVVAGHSLAVERLILIAAERGAKIAKKLPMSVPSHCFLMKSAAEKLAKHLDTLSFNIPQIPVIHNVDVSEHQSSLEIKESLIKQLYFPVRWTEIMNKLAHFQIKKVIECGPGKVLTGLSKRITPSPSEAISISSPAAFQDLSL
ncbi:MAG: [acyl-carrier-protein] S-malonyltransferase [Gammaproteobacteria bacterium RIFCSPLOWO2_02_FULL_38_11]|nr:MAG: [acyl-carrier-protein] S-malonyltransferase [Gammaproteobacteria bacterium RIFCSPHIGHO2_02_FULL_38_33]OGT23508.1 MAG: [acyl-carrier-protein] S-malonyltransferase [Gammaproteobacteria bacterium RIFCSPHIGHO2_12_38_15]OGT69576.1 MAG: [acyl-carrier-protein] S-malonyltransferase [Gammaproteobacteria bacterium RIFCSPLOWO2_02_FULL_38_11]